MYLSPAIHSPLNLTTFLFRTSKGVSATRRIHLICIASTRQLPRFIATLHLNRFPQHGDVRKQSPLSTRRDLLRFYARTPR